LLPVHNAKKAKPGLANQVVTALQQALGAGPASLHEPCLSEVEQNYLQQCLASGFVSSVGPFVDQFESDLAAFTGARHAVAMVNGTAALQVALQLAGVGPSDEVVVPALSFVATANAVHYLGATPLFADSNEGTLGLDPEALRTWLASHTERTESGTHNRQTGRPIRAIVPMHTFGHPCDIQGILAVAHDFGLAVIEDAAESLGSLYLGSHTGTFGRLGALSFNGNKIVTTGGGGAILTNDPALAAKAKHLTTTAKLPHRWAYDHDQIGYNFRMPNLNAALGCAQLKKLPDFLASKRRLSAAYAKAFRPLIESGRAQLMQEPPDCTSNYWLQTLVLHASVSSERDAVLEATNNAGFSTRPAWRLLHELGPYKQSPRTPLPVAESLAARIINLPSSAGLA
jgi:aminotransferase in exopolysaccharide biosynthesis